MTLYIFHQIWEILVTIVCLHTETNATVLPCTYAAVLITFTQPLLLIIHISLDIKGTNLHAVNSLRCTST